MTPKQIETLQNFQNTIITVKSEIEKISLTFLLSRQKVSNWIHLLAVSKEEMNRSFMPDIPPVNETSIKILTDKLISLWKSSLPYDLWLSYFFSIQNGLIKTASDIIDSFAALGKGALTGITQLGETLKWIAPIVFLFLILYGFKKVK